MFPVYLCGNKKEAALCKHKAAVSYEKDFYD
jgi:hypothetical protein